MRALEPRPGLLLLLLLVSASAHAARDCQFVVGENQRHARAVVHLTRAYSDTMGWVRAMEDHADRIFIDPQKAWRATAALGAGTLLGVSGQDCRADGTWTVVPTSADASFIAGFTYRPLALKLTFFGVGRMDQLGLSTDASASSDADALYRLAYGANLQVTDWISIGAMRVAHADDPADDPALRVTRPARRDPWLLEIGIPRVGLFALLNPDGEQALFQRLAIEDVPITDRLAVTARLERSPTEARWLLGPAARYTLIKRSGPSLDLGADLRIENAPANLRHARVAAIVPLLKSGFTRRRTSGGIGAHIEQRASLSVHRGAELQRVSGADAAVGATWESLIRMQSHVFYIDFLLNFGVNHPEVLDLFPGAVNGLNFRAAMRWGGHF